MSKDIEVFPAYAGVSPALRRTGQPTGRLPRLRGGEPGASADWAAHGSSSPPTRG